MDPHLPPLVVIKDWLPPIENNIDKLNKTINENEELEWEKYTDKVWNKWYDKEFTYDDIPSWWFEENEDEYGDGTREGTIPTKEEYIMNLRQNRKKKIYPIIYRLRIAKTVNRRNTYLEKKFIY